MQSKAPARRLCLPGAAGPEPGALLLPPLGRFSLVPPTRGSAGAWPPPSLCPWRAGGMEAPEPTSPDASGYLPLLTAAGEVTSRAPARRRGAFGVGAAGGCCLSRCGGGRPAPPRGSICGAAPAKPVNQADIKAPAAQALTTLAAGSERTVPAQMFGSSFSQLQRAAEFTRKAREGKESWPVEGPQQKAHASLCSFTGRVRPAPRRVPPF